MSGRWALEAAGGSLRYDRTDPELSEATVVQNLVERARNRGWDEERIHRVEDEVSQIMNHILYVTDPRNGFIERSERPAIAQNPNGLVKYLFNTRLDRLFQRLRSFLPFGVTGNAFDNGLRTISLDFTKFGNRRRVENTLICSDRNMLRPNRHFLSPEDHVYLSWKMRVLTETDRENAPVVCLYSGTWNEDEMFMLVGGAAALLYTYTVNDNPDRWAVDFLENNALGIEAGAPVEVQLTENQAHLGRLLCLIFNGGSARDEEGTVRAFDGLCPGLIGAGRNPGRVQINLQNADPRHFVNLLGLGYSLALSCETFTKCNFGMLWRRAYRTNREFFDQFEGIFEFISRPNLQVFTTFDCGCAFCIPDRWVSLHRVNPRLRH